MKHTDDFTHKENTSDVAIFPGDVSARAIELARILDRLPPGQHIITLHKPDVRAMDWKAEIVAVVPNRTIHLPKKMTGPSSA